MKKINYFLAIATFLLSTNLYSSLSRIRNIVQSGKGTIGKIKIILMKDDYDFANIEKEYTDDSVEIVLRNAFIIPVRRVFKSSSNKSSVARIIVTQETGDTARVSIKFRIPIDIIKQEDKISLETSKIIYTYNTKPKKLIPIAKKENIVQKDEPKILAPIKRKIIKAKTKIKNTHISSQKAHLKIQKENRKTSSFSFSTILIALATISLLIFLGIIVYTIRKIMIYNQINLRKIEDEYGMIRVVDKLRLGFTKKLFVIEVEQKRLLLATYKNRIRLLTELGKVYYEEENQNVEQAGPDMFEHFNEKDFREELVDRDDNDEFKTRLK